MLLTGGYLVLERPNAGIVLSTTARFYAIVRPIYDEITPESWAWVSILPQFFFLAFFFEIEFRDFYPINYFPTLKSVPVDILSLLVSVQTGYGCNSCFTRWIV